jgi:hypothetical protein
MGFFDAFKKAKRPERVRLEEQIEKLARLGIRMSEGMTIDVLLAESNRDSYEGQPYINLLLTYGGEAEVEPNHFKRISGDFLALDAECIEGGGSYVKVAEWLLELAKGQLPMTEVSDDFDVVDAYDDLANVPTGSTVGFSFLLDGDRQTWQLAFLEDWLDEAFVEKFAELLTKRGARVQYAVLNQGESGQVMNLMCCTAKVLERVVELTGWQANWVGEPPKA